MADYVYELVDSWIADGGFPSKVSFVDDGTVVEFEAEGNKWKVVMRQRYVEALLCVDDDRDADQKVAAIAKAAILYNFDETDNIDFWSLDNIIMGWW
jgi:hypothetical protein